MAKESGQMLPETLQFYRWMAVQGMLEHEIASKPRGDFVIQLLVQKGPHILNPLSKTQVKQQALLKHIQLTGDY